MLITTTTVAQTCNVSRATIERWRRDPALNFPRPIKIGPKSVRFDADELAAWIASRRAVEVA
ncbi:helix-turn-helix transcriptional regulator [Aeromonas veronii]|uniref:helix-turn-helix transcriptional regulator n=1 Tax=Aeromonas veronii TaxID=654 RepID=UPI0028DACCED|nr:AlpA family phage regulatory protein [Aeromonas dhakensis]